MLVELAGLPGAGKTTFAKRLVTEGYTLVHIENRSELLRYNLLFAALHPVTFIRTLLWLCGNLGSRNRWRLKFANLFLVHNAKYMKAGQFTRAVIDQGHHQNVLSLFDTAIAKEKLRRYIAILPKPDMLVLFDVSKGEREERMKERGHTVREEEEALDREAWLFAAEKHYAYLLHLRTENMLPFPSVVIDGKDDERTIALLRKRTWYYVMNARMPTEKAHGLQIAKSCEALRRNGESVVLWIPRRVGSAASTIGAYYGLRETFPARIFGTPTFAGNWVPSRLRFLLQSFSFCLALLVVRLDNEGIHFTRSAEIAWLLKKRGVRTVIYEAHLWPESKRALFAFFLRDVDLIVANSVGTSWAFQEAGFTKIIVAHNGVDLGNFFTDEGRENARHLLGLPGGKRIVCYSGSFYRWKGVPLLLEAWKKQCALRDDLLLLLVGGGVADLSREGADGVASSIGNLLLVPHQGAAKIPSYLRAADLLVLPTAPVSREAIAFTSPIKLFEYMASGRPIVAADLPSIREIVSEQEVAFARAGDADDLSRVLVELLGDPRRGEQLAMNAREKAKGYDWGSRMRKIAEEIERISIS